MTFQKCLNSGINLFSSKNRNKSQTFATGAYQRLHEARPRRIVWLWEPEYWRARPISFIAGYWPRFSVTWPSLPVLLRPVNSFLGQVIGNASEGKYNTVNNSSSEKWPFKNAWIRELTYFHLKIGTSHKHSPLGHTRGYMKLGHAA